MIPAPVPPLKDCTVLVTRPAEQAAELCRQLEAYGGTALAFPAMRIEPLAVPSMTRGTPTPADAYDLVVFVSVNAVMHGLRWVERAPTTRIAAVGRTTAAALRSASVPVQLVPDHDYTSEALLRLPELLERPPRRALIVRGGPGRETLRSGLEAFGSSVDTLDVYRRDLPSVDPAQLDALESRWATEGIDVVTVTSVEILRNLHALLADRGRSLLTRTPLLTVSGRIALAARELGYTGEVIPAPAADDATLVGTLAKWRTRARF